MNLPKINPEIVLRIGLALVFLANSLTAAFSPDEFAELIEASYISSLLPFETGKLVPLIAINDAAIALLLLLGSRLKMVLLWAGIWILGVMAVIGEPLEILEESGALAIVVAVYISITRTRGKRARDGTV